MNGNTQDRGRRDGDSWARGLIRFSVARPAVVLLLAALAIVWGVLVAPFDWDLGGIPRHPVPADAIPDIGENQQIVFTPWPGRSPRDVEDQLTYPLTAALMGVPGVKTVRCSSMFGFSSVHVIFNEGVDYYWSRSRLLEKLNSLPPGTLPEGVRPALGPDATALGQVFWYTLEGVDSDGRLTGGWDLDELRTVQDWHVRYALLSAEGVSEVASIGGHVMQYHVDVDPDLMRAHAVELMDVVEAVRRTNQDVGADSVEINQIEYYVRGVGYVTGTQDLARALVKTTRGVPVLLEQVARVSLGPAQRLGALDKNGGEVVGGVVVARYGENPLAAIGNVKAKIAEIAPGLPSKTLPDGRVSRLAIVPFYDRSELIGQTLGALEEAIGLQVLVTVLVVVAMLRRLAGSMLVAGLLPVAVLLSFIAMKAFGVDANIVALSGLAIAIGTMVDMGIIIIENVERRLHDAPPDADRAAVVLEAAREVGGSVVTAASTTIVSFLPVFAMEGAEGKLFQPLAYAKTFALFAAIMASLTVLPALARIWYGRPRAVSGKGWVLDEAMVYAGAALAVWADAGAGILLAAVGAYRLAVRRLPARAAGRLEAMAPVLAVGAVLMLLSGRWSPLGPGEGYWPNTFFIALVIGLVLGVFFMYQRRYTSILRWCLRRKRAFLTSMAAFTCFGLLAWVGLDGVLGWMPDDVRRSAPYSAVSHTLPGFKKEFMPQLDEGSFLYMPVAMPHASIAEMLDILRTLDLRLSALPEVESAVGKLGRADSPLDPAPVSMIETVVTYRDEYLRDGDGGTPLFRFDPGEPDYFRTLEGLPVAAPDGEPYVVPGRFERDERGRLVEDSDGRPFRLWRPALLPELNPGRDPWAGVNSRDDIWRALSEAGALTGLTAAPKLQPISARVVMLQTGINAGMGVKVSGPGLDAIQDFSLAVEKALRRVAAVDPDTVIAERVTGRPYLEIHVDRLAAAQNGLTVRDVQDVVEYAVGGKTLTSTVEGRERFAVRVRYPRELRDDAESIGRILVTNPDGAQIPLEQVARVRYAMGPQVIKSVDTFLTSYVLFEKRDGFSEVETVEMAGAAIRQGLENGSLVMPEGVSFSFVGNFENQVRAQKRLALILPLTLLIIFMILFVHFGKASVAGLVFTGIAAAWGGGFVMMWLYAQPWFMDFTLLGANMRDVFQIQTLHLSVAVWVGFLALFGIATDDGVLMAASLERGFAGFRPGSVEDIREAVVRAALTRLRPCLMTSATTILALLPVLTSTGRGSEIMTPMAVPTTGGMVFSLSTILVVPVLYCFLQERRFVAAQAAEALPADRDPHGPGSPHSQP